MYNHSITQVDSVVKNGTVIIVDISGFTELVYGTDLMAGRNIIRRMLSTIVKANRLGLNIAEIEGDAVFFYRFGDAPVQREVLAQYEEMLHDFMDTISEISEIKRKRMPLSLKMVVHYGDIAQYQLGGFDKLYGKVVTEAHMLLKNKLKTHSYVLMTEDYLRHTAPGVSDGVYTMINQCEIYGGMKKLCYSCFDYSRTTLAA